MDKQNLNDDKDEFSFLLPSQKKMQLEMEGMEQLLERLVRNEKVGKNLVIIENFKRQLKGLRSEFESIATTIENFNTHFQGLGWIAYDSWNLSIAEKAVELADSEQIDQAELYLTDCIDRQAIETGLLMLRAVRAFDLRHDLANKAKEDYLAERYHAVVPLLILLIDGMVNEIEPTGFFAEPTNISAWNSIAAHGERFNQLKVIFTIQRKEKTSIDQLSIPYRHGIMHGRDLGFDNKLVSAKLWSVLFALRDWAVVVERGEGEQPEGFELKSISSEEAAQNCIEAYEDKKKIELDLGNALAWEPFNIVVGTDCPVCGEPGEYEEGTPQRVVIEFLNFWKAENFGKIVPLIDLNLEDSEQNQNFVAGKVRDVFGQHRLLDYELDSIDNFAAAVTKILVMCSFEQNSKITSRFLLHLWYEKDGEYGIGRYEEGGKWRIQEFDPGYSLSK